MTTGAPGRSAGSRPDARRLLAGAVEAAWARDPSLGLLLALLSERCEVALVPGAGTARICRTGAGTRVELDPAFLDDFVRTPDDLVFLLVHEVLHRVQGDLVRGLAPPRDPRAQFVANLVADVRLNAHLLRGPFSSGVGLIDRCYADATLPGLLLLPPNRLLALRGAVVGRPGLVRPWTLEDVVHMQRSALEEAVMAIFRHAAPPDPRRLGELAGWYIAAWCDETHQVGLYRGLLELLPAEDEVVRFLGGHPPAEGTTLGDDELQAAGEAVGAGRGGDRRRDRTAIRLVRATDELRRVLRRALDPSAREDPSARPPQPTVVPTPGRREVFLLAAGCWPGMFRAPLPRREREGERARVYLDVSGSTAAAQPHLMGLLGDLKDLVADPVHQFSTEVVDVTLAELAAGERRTTGGTDFTPVLRHALAARARRIVVFTDGEGPLSPAAAAAAARAHLEVHVLLTEPCPRSPLVTIARSCNRLPMLRR